MTKAVHKLTEIEQNLEKNFLYNGDNQSFRILVSILDNKNVVKYKKPKFVCMKYINLNLRKLFSSLPNQDLIINSLNSIIADDINRFELLISLNSYFSATYDIESIDKLERFSLDQLGSSFLYANKNLFEYSDREDALQLKDELMSKTKNNKEFIQKLKLECKLFSEKVFKNKILNLDLHLDRQIVIRGGEFVDTKELELDELFELYKKVLTYFSNKILDVYIDSYRMGLNVTVINRYR
ncbi:MAG: hypothetical protein SOZ89_05160 [Peptoniphilaceae bacterium]|nr:hypothetical protein [Peptoniphilaceae bacterium]MDD7383442.1 hypothetical protein [Peptoniphilaceae bacterium]MDY3738494.1 hypothetical protein [Peptoniphilaceae bacterium]